MPQKYQKAAQQTLDELLKEGAIPFKLEARKVVVAGPNELLIHFHDSRLHSVTVEVDESDSIKNPLRAAVLRELGARRPFGHAEKHKKHAAGH